MKVRRSGCFGNIVVVLIAVVLIFFGFCAGLLVSEDVAIKTLETHGFSDIQIVDRAWFLIPLRGGSNTDNVRFEATAVNPAGHIVTVYVYAGWPFKGGTVRAK